MFEIAFLCATAVMFAAGFLAATTLDAMKRRKLHRVFGIAICAYFVLGYLVITNLDFRAPNWSVLLVAPLASVLGIAIIPLVKRRAGALILRIDHWNWMVFMALLFVLFLVILIPLLFNQVKYSLRYPSTSTVLFPSFIGFITILGSTILFLVRGFQKKELRERGVLEYGNLNLWGDFVSFYWGANKRDESVVELILVRKSWLRLSPNLKCKIKKSDQPQLDALIAQHLPRTISESSAIVTSS